MLNNIEIKILDQRLGIEFPMPAFATSGSAGFDLRALITEPLQLAPDHCELIKTGIAIHIRNPNYCAMILPRSGLGHKHGIVLGNLTGLIDSDYQGELLVSCWNRSLDHFTIQPGDRIAQLIFMPVARPELTIVNEFEKSNRGTQGFGHTGIE